MPPRPVPRRAGVVSGVLAGVCALAAAGLSIGGVFAVVHSVSNTHRADSGANFGYDITWWGLNYQRGSDVVSDQDSLSGLAPLTAAAILILGAVFVFVAARSGRLLTASRSVLSLGTGLLAGAVVLQLLATLQDMAVWNEEELDPGESIEFAASLGLWLPLGGVVLAAVAAVLAHLGRRAAAVRVEPNTPRMGFPMPYRPGGPVPGQQPTGPGQSSGRYPAVGTSTGQHPVVGAPAAPSSPPSAEAPAPDAPTAAPPVVGAEAAAAHAAAPIAAPPAEESTADAELTQRTTVLPPPTPPAAPRTSVAEALSGSTREPSPAEPAPPSVPAAPTPPSTPVAPATTPPATTPPAAPPAAAEAGPESPAEPPPSRPAAPEPAAEAGPPATPAPSTSDRPAPGSSGLLDLPAAPPAPELAAEEEKKEK